MFVELSRLTWEDAERIAGSEPALGLIPTGSVEQHGPHLPLMTDSLLAAALARAAADQIEASVIVPPVIHTGLSSHHVGFGGTITLDEPTFTSVIDAYMDMFRRLGLERVAIFSGHGGNFQALREYAPVASRTHGMTVVSYADFQRLIDVLHRSSREAGLDPAETDVHAGVFETSLVLHLLGGDAVKPFDHIVGWAGDDPDEVRHKPEGVKKVSATGILGSPQGASADAGRIVFNAWAADLRDWLGEQFDLEHR